MLKYIYIISKSDKSFYINITLGPVHEGRPNEPPCFFTPDLWGQKKQNMVFITRNLPVKQVKKRRESSFCFYNKRRKQWLLLLKKKLDKLLHYH